jgi:hypothetical protein
MDLHRELEGLGAAVPAVLLPRPGRDLEKWGVIACDQFTQDRAFWERQQTAREGAASTLDLIFPEVYLEDPDREARISRIHRTMLSYREGGVFDPPRRGLVYIERATPFHPCRRGLLLMVDLERYDWEPQARPLIRSTEGTVPERLPPRMEVRRGAALETPHILLLIDDDEDALLPALGAAAREREVRYETALSPEAGHIRGWFLDREADWALLAEGLGRLARRAETRYGPGPYGPYGHPQEAPFLYAVGDGNHSLAAAKAVWEEYKGAHPGDPGLMDHPARWALAELENLYDPGISFEPIHRLLRGTDTAALLPALLAAFGALPGFSSRPVADREQLTRLVGDPAAPRNRLGLIAGDARLLVETDAPGLATGFLQPLLDRWLRDQAAAGLSLALDYIHGGDELFRLAEDRAAPVPALGILLPPVKKSGLFQTVAASGPLPRKSFSMGEAIEKRFYLECRELFTPAALG